MQFTEWLKTRLAQIRDAETKYGVFVPIPGCDPWEIESFREAIHRTFSVSVPDEYLDFLSLQDGGGELVSLFGTRPRLIEQNGIEIHINGLIVENLELRDEHSRFEQMLLFGSSDMGYLGQKVGSNIFVHISSIGGHQIQTFSDAEEMIRYALSGA